MAAVPRACICSDFRRLHLVQVQGIVDPGGQPVVFLQEAPCVAAGHIEQHQVLEDAGIGWSPGCRVAHQVGLLPEQSLRVREPACQQIVVWFPASSPPWTQPINVNDLPLRVKAIQGVT